MHRIDATNAVSVMPTPNTAGTPGYFNHGNPSTGANFTTVTSDWCNAVQEELMSVITAAGITADKTQQGQLLAAIQSLTRVKRNGLNLYVNTTTGSDSLSGYGFASGTPFKTLQAAVSAITTQYDLMGSTATIYCADGVYTQGATVSGLYIPNGQIHFVGNTTTPQNCKIAMAAGGTCFRASENANISISGFALESTPGTSGALWTNAGVGLGAANGGVLSFDHCAFGACTYTHIYAGAGGLVQVPSSGTPYSIYGGSVAHAIVSRGVISIPSAIVTVTGTPAFSTAFVSGDLAGLIFAPSSSFTGSATGARYVVSNGSAIITNGGGANFFPGNAVGSNFSGYYS